MIWKPLCRSAFRRAQEMRQSFGSRLRLILWMMYSRGHLCQQFCYHTHVRDPFSRRATRLYTQEVLASSLSLFGEDYRLAAYK